MKKLSRARGQRIHAWMRAGALAVAVSACAVARVEGQTETDTFANNSPAAVYQDSYSSSCDEKNGTSLAMDSPDPGRCFDQPATNGKCASIGGEGSTFAGQTGNVCHYCQEAASLPGNEIVVPNESGGAATAAYQQGYVCSANPGDGCYLTCYGTKKFTPPAGTTQKSGTGGGSSQNTEGGPPPIKNANSRSPLVGHLIFDYSDACHPAGVEQYNVCDYPNLPRPKGCVCPTKPAPAVKPTTNTPAAAPLQAASDFSDKLRADAEKMLQAAGRISKAMTDSMDVTKHNNVGINVALTSMLGALGKTISFTAQQYQLAAAAKVTASAAEQSAVLEIAGEAAAESGTLASEAEQLASEAGQAGAAPGGGPTGTGGGSPPVNSPMGAGGGINLPGDLPYMDDMLYLGKAAITSQGDLPICGVLSCLNIAQLLGKNVPSLRMLSTGLTSTGMNPAQMVAALQRVGISAQITAGSTQAAARTALLNLVNQGKPLIAGVYIEGAEATTQAAAQAAATGAKFEPDLHAVVIEGMQMQGKQAGFLIYDPAGWYYWQPVTTFFKYFTGVVVHPV